MMPGMRFPLLAAFVFVSSLASAQAGPPLFVDAGDLVRWLIGHAGGHGFDGTSDRANATVFSPGLRAAIRESLARSRQRGEPPCGANGDLVLDLQEYGEIRDLNLVTEKTDVDRATVRATFESVTYRRDLRFMAVRLDGIWMIENIVTSDGHSLRRSLGCR